MLACCPKRSKITFVEIVMGVEVEAPCLFFQILACSLLSYDYCLNSLCCYVGMNYSLEVESSLKQTAIVLRSDLLV